jgi:myo-inositol-1(or 4)-monophosphatase
MPPRSAILNVMAGAARKAARGLLRDYGEIEQLQVSKKGPGDFVSAADMRAEEIIREELTRARPGFAFLMEESGIQAGSDSRHRFIVDPLDGTTNFLHGIPHFAVSIALEDNEQIVAGVIYEPIRDEMFIAERGKGAFLNDRRLRVSARTSLAEAVIATGIPHMGKSGHDIFIKELAAVMSGVAGVRRAGTASLDLAYVAAGRYDGYWERDICPWDMAAGLIVLREAGGLVSDLAGGPHMLQTGNIVAANSSLHAALLAYIQRATQSD